jgi:hypothetical protein
LHPGRELRSRSTQDRSGRFNVHARAEYGSIDDELLGYQRTDLTGPLEGGPVEPGLALEGGPVEPGLALEGGPVEPGLALEGGPAEPSLAREGRSGEKRLATKDCPIEPGAALKDRPVELSYLEC